MELTAYLAKNNIDMEEFKSILKDYMKFFKTEKKSIISMIKRNPNMITLDTKTENQGSVQDFLKFYKKTFSLIDGDLYKCFIKEPELLNLSKEDVLFKIKFYQKLFNITDKECKEVIANNPILLLQDINSNKKYSLMSKLAFYKKALGLTKEETCLFIKNEPSYLYVDKLLKFRDNHETAQKYVSQIASKEEILKNPQILSFPALRVKFRYLVLSAGLTHEEIVSDSKLMRHEKITWGRWALLKENGASMKKLALAKRKFEAEFGIKDDELVPCYPITIDSIREVEDDYARRTGKSLYLDASEIMTILGEDQKVNEKIKLPESGDLEMC